MARYLSEYTRFFIFSIMVLFLLSMLTNAHPVKHAEKFIVKEGLNIKRVNESDNLNNKIKEQGEKTLDINTDNKNNIKTSSIEMNHIVEQAKSYALGKFNNLASGEMQKWLSQFGTAKINVSLDRKGKLDNRSLDFLFPFYDDKEDWLFFSQLGYGNKDNRNTVNFGLGGRYVTSRWMYGFNSFYDYDITGKNKRLGLGGEVWADYLKLSVNTYWRLKNWQQSIKEIDYEERPANGFDLKSEFFLPVYPSLGGRLSYEQYFGDNVALFNHHSKQKDPGLARFGLSYTPIPLITMAVDYKYASGGHSETQFQANLNYRFGVTFDTQFSPYNIASMRTLAGSRYDLVERNNSIVLDYRKKQALQVTLPHSIHGYTAQMKSVTANVISDKPIKQITWRAGEEFTKNGGKFSNIGNPMVMILPKYIYNGVNSYPIYAVVEEENGKRAKTAEMLVTIEPFVIKGKPQITPSTNDIVADGESAFTLAVAVTHGHQNNSPLPLIAIQDVKWTVELPKGSSLELKDAIKLQWDESSTTNDTGQLSVKVTSTKPVQNATVYFEMEGMPKVRIAKISFSDIQSKYAIDSITVSPQTPIALGDNNDSYTFVATILGPDGQLLKNQNIDAQWRVNPDNGDVELKGSDKTDAEGRLIATLSSKTWKSAKIQVGLIIEKEVEKFSEFVAFVEEDKNIHVQSLTIDQAGPLEATGENEYTFIATVVGSDGKPFPKSASVSPIWKIENGVPGMKLIVGAAKPNNKGELTATVTSTQAVKDARISVSLQDDVKTLSPAFSFSPAKVVDIVFKSDIEVSPDGPIWGNGHDAYTYRILLIDPKSGQPMRNWSLANVNWNIENKDLPDKLIFKEQQITTDAEGYLTASLVSTVGMDGIIAQMSIITDNKEYSIIAKIPVSFKAKPQEAGLHLISGHGGDSYIAATRQREPYNVYGDLIIRLTKESTKPVHIVGENVEYQSSGELVKVSQSGNITFPAENFRTSKGITIVTAKVTEPQTGEQTIYEYRFNPQRYVFTPEFEDDGYVKLGENSENSTCETLDPKYSWGRRAISMTDQDIGISASTETSRSLHYEYKHFPGFGILPYPFGLNNTKIKVANSHNPSQFFLYDYATGEKVDSNPEDMGRLLCKLLD
ncbi:inverse autotransporter beta domain-containing protein [Xenorhabdus thuongxuanensis]|uniref:Putative invasin n=1 Tax=Xenorhabdus thuongxuanensis TaxID=1873484 RepID=A0A1Q5U287_9GAMM|nr:inverse autotransporter beta domain-containing protein [Xenorhabdus thuongxuanensis]OKP06608.1 putative invasin [Xenorhabdus thuongxuanensis]